LRLLNSQCLLLAVALIVKPFRNNLNWALNENGDGGGCCEGVTFKVEMFR